MRRSVNQLLQGFSDVDATDVLVALAGPGRRSRPMPIGNALDEVAGTIFPVWKPMVF